MLEHTWSLCLEENFYLLWPPVVAFIGAHRARQLLFWLVLPTALATAAATTAPERCQPMATTCIWPARRPVMRPIR